MDIVQIEIPIVVVVVIIQFGFFFFTLIKISVLKNLFRRARNINLSERQSDSEHFSVIRIDNNAHYNNSIYSFIERNKSNRLVRYLYPAIFDEIVNSINHYLKKNSKAATDFNLIKDIVERNTNTLEDEVHSTISVPLYLGLMGTMLGVVIGLFNMPDLQAMVTDENLGSGISTLLGGVKVAMIASIVGLALTVTNSSFFLRAAKIKLDREKDKFYTFIQTQLLPIVNQGLNATFDSLQRNLIRFNDAFTVNLDRLSGIFETNFDALRTQEKVLNMLSTMDLVKTAKYNVDVLQQLQLSMEEFEKFSQYLHGMNTFIGKINNLIKRTENFEKIAENLDNKLEDGKILMKFIESHFKELEDRKKLIENAIVDVDNVISEALKGLKNHTSNSIENVKKFTIDETVALKSALSDARSNLGNLAYLENLNKDLSLFKNSSASQGERLRQEIQAMQNSIEKLIGIMSDINERQKENVIKRLFSRSEKSQTN